MEESLVLKFDATSAPQAAQQIDKLTKSSDRASTSLEDLIGESKDAGKALKDVGGDSAAQAIGRYAGRLSGVAGSLVRISSVGAAAAAAGAAIFRVMKDTEDQNLRLSQALIVSGNAADTTSGQLNATAESLARIAGRADAVAVLAALAESGKVASQQLRGAAETALLAQKLLGIGSQQLVADFVALGTQPAAAIKSLNDKYNFLTVDVYRQVRALEDEGRTAEAAALAQRTFHEEMQGRVTQAKESLGVFQRTGQAFVSTFRAMGGAVRDLFDTDSLEERLGKLNRLLAEVDGTGGRRRNVNIGPQRAQRLREERDALQKLVDLDAEIAKTNAQIAARQAAAIDQEEKAARRGEEVSRKRSQLRRDRLALDVTQIQEQLKTELAAFTNQSTILEAQRNAKLISEAEYYAKRRGLLEQSTQTQVRALDEEAARLRRETAQVQADAQKAQEALNRMRTSGGPQLDRVEEEATRKTSEAQQVQLRNAARLVGIDEERARLLAEMLTTQTALGIQQEFSRKTQERALADARASAAELLAVQERQRQRELDGLGAGERQRQFDAGIGEIEDRYAQQRYDLERDRPDLDPAIYAEKQRLIQDSLKAELDAYRRHWGELLAGELNWRNGASEAIRNYVDESTKSATQTQTVITNAMRGAEDAWVKFVQTGKLSFRDLINSVIADLARLSAQKAFASLFSNFLPIGGAAANGAAFATGGIPAFANGGAFTNRIVSQPTMFGFSKGIGLMGEAGPEAIMPLRRTRGGQLGVMAAGGAAAPSVSIHNYAGAKVDTEWSNGELRVVIREEARRQVESEAPRVIAGQLENPNSRVSKALSRNTTAARQRN